ncbi:DUF2955 domain-containing protein [Pseudomonas sp. MDT1-85]
MPIRDVSTQRTPRVQRALRLATGTALCLAASFGLGLPIPFLAPVLAVLLLATLNRSLPFKAGLILALAAMLTTGVGLLLIPILRYYPITGVLLIGVSLFLAFGFGLRGGNTLIMTFLIIGLTMISSAGVAEFDLAMMIILLGQSVQDSAAGKDVYTAFAVRMGLFIALTLYACLMVYLLDQRQRTITDAHGVT